VVEGFDAFVLAAGRSLSALILNVPSCRVLVVLIVLLFILCLCDKKELMIWDRRRAGLCEQL
jgi:hypothetical protein